MGATPDTTGIASAQLGPRAIHYELITPDDANDLTKVSKGILLGVAGDLEIDCVGDEGDTTVVIPNLAAGIFHPIIAKRVRDANTTATGIVVCW